MALRGPPAPLCPTAVPLRVRGFGGHEKNTLVTFPKEPTAHVGRRRGTQCLQITLQTADDKSECIIHSL